MCLAEDKLTSWIEYQRANFPPLESRAAWATGQTHRGVKGANATQSDRPQLTSVAPTLLPPGLRP